MVFPTSPVAMWFPSEAEMMDGTEDEKEEHTEIKQGQANAEGMFEEPAKPVELDEVDCRIDTKEINEEPMNAVEVEEVESRKDVRIMKDVINAFIDNSEELNDLALLSPKFTFRRAGIRLAPDPSIYSITSLQSNKSNAYVQRKIKMKEKLGGDMDDRIVEVPTTCFGEVEFRGASRRSIAKFIRVSNETPPKMVYDLMIKYWLMDPPRLLISVTGGAKNFNLSPLLKQNFTVGLSKVAATHGCWVISGGTNCGVMKHVGEALQGATQACIGIATWGVITNRNALNPATVSSRVARHVDNTYTYEVGSWLTEKGAYLDSNHTHFLLVDNGTENEYGVEIPFRGRLEQYLMVKALKGKDGFETVPTVLLVLEGGPGTLGTIHSAVSGENPVPVVIVKSSGRAADLVACALTMSEEILDADKEGGHEGLMEGIAALFPELNDEKKQKAYEQVVSCLEYDDMFTVTQVGGDVDIDDAILTALLNDKHTSTYRQLQLALSWNRADLAREKTMATISTWDANCDPRELEWIMIMALAKGNVEFVELLMEYGVCVSHFLREELLDFLYGFRSHFKTSPLRYEFSGSEYRPIPINSPNVNVYRYLCSKEELISEDEVTLPRYHIENLLRSLCSPFIRDGNEKFIEDLNLRDLDDNTTFRYPFRELFIWAVLNNMQEMADFMWRKGEEHMAKGLIGAHLCDALIERRITQDDIEYSLKESSRMFKDSSLQLLDHCFKVNDHITRTLITYDLAQFSGINVINLAVASENLDFVSHHAVQELLENVWTGNLKLKKINLIKVFLSCIFIFPILLPNLFQFRTLEEISSQVEKEDPVDADDDDDDEKLEEVRKQRRMTMKRKRSKVERGLGTQLSDFRKLTEFYFYTPVVTFVTHVVGYVLFLCLFAYVTMLEKTHSTPTALEWLVIVTVFAYLLAEIYQILQVDAPTALKKYYLWSSSLLNLFDISVILFYFVALGLRLSSVHSVHRAGHVLYAIDCGLWIFRLLTVCFISPTLGPYLVMIKKMCKDLLQFLSVLIVVIIGYGVITTAILEPFHEANIKMIRNPLWHPYFNIYGELFIDRDRESNETTRFGTPTSKTYDETIVWILMGVYLLFTNILLLNLLIAVFNNTYNSIAEKSSQVWKFRRYHLIMEYADRHALFPPFSILGHSFLLVRWIYRKCRGYPTRRQSGLSSDVTDKMKEDLIQFECKCMTLMIRSKMDCISKSVEEMASEILEEVDYLKSEMHMIKDKVNSNQRERGGDDRNSSTRTSRSGSIATPIRRISAFRLKTSPSKS